MMPLRMGLNPLPDDHRDLQFSDYLRAPRIPEKFGHESLVANWGMLGNDEWGDCAIAGPGHEHMLWTAAAGKPVQFTTAGVLSDYSAITGFDPSKGAPGQNPTDRGSDVRAVAKYRQQTGVVDAKGNRHKIAAYVFLNPGNVYELMLACYLFEVVGIGLVMQEAQMDQFNQGKAWEVVPGSPDAGGHYVCGVQRKGRTTADAITWARPQPFTTHFYRARSDQAVAYLTDEMLTGGKSLEGFDQAQLLDDLKQLGVVGQTGKRG